jgi:hypothetical protein
LCVLSFYLYLLFSTHRPSISVWEKHFKNPDFLWGIKLVGC